MDERARRLCWHGMALFLLGLLTGLAVRRITHPRTGLGRRTAVPTGTRESVIHGGP